jgi:phospholipid/cholesterol/gamma-HCH transport system substrate-binding protein
MAQKKLYFLVGLFVTVGVLLGVTALIWVGASKYFQKGLMYVTYFDESVQGLQVDSIVKYRGVDIGRVNSIGVAPDQRLIEVAMKIHAQDLSVSEVVAKLTMAGITGIVFVELDRQKPGQEVKPPKLDFEPPYPVITATASDIKQIESSINQILDSLKQIDFKGISEQTMRTVKIVDDFVSGERMKRIVVNVEQVSANLASVSKKADAIMNDGNVEQVIVSAREAIKEARSAIGQVKTEIEGMKMTQTVGSINQLVEGTSKRVQLAATEVEVTSETLRRAAESLEGLVDRLNADPSALIFSSPPTRRIKGE